MWLVFVSFYICSAIIFTQFFKVSTKTSKNDGALVILLQFVAGLSSLLLVPFFSFTFPSDWKVYLFLGLACIFYAIADRMNGTVRSGIEASTFSIIKQISTVIMILAGLLFFKEPFVLRKIIGAGLIIFSNILVFYKKGNQKLDKYVMSGIVANLFFSVALFLDVNISEHFNLPFYVTLTLWIPALFILIAERIKLSTIKKEFQNGNKKAILITGLFWGFSIVVSLKAYQLGDVTTIAPLSALTVIGNVIVGYLFLKERNNLLKKIIAALLIIISIILIKG
jgi:Predicted membrane protein